MNQTAALQIDHLSKRFGRSLALDGLSLSVEPGQVYGFLGQNGAGKTTTIRILLDLVRPTGGSVALFGKNPRRERSVLRRVGALVEGAAFYPYLSGRANLELLRRMDHGVSESIDGLLHRVGLAGRGDDHFSTYSTGMKQRLGIAGALLGNPDLVILDEPTNGLDPVGRVEIRELVRALVDRDGKTVFLSSHLLGEVEQICDRVAIIDKGRLVREGPIADLLAEREHSMCIEVDDPQQAISALAEKWRAVPIAGTSSIQVFVSRTETPGVIQRLTGQQIAIYTVTPPHRSLEDLFLSLVDPHV